MLTNESYRMYLDAQEQLRQRKEEEQRLAEEQEISSISRFAVTIFSPCTGWLLNS